MATLENITSSDWQLSLKNAGGVVQDVNDINQCIQTILSTAKGSNPIRLDFGCDLWLFVDQPVNTAIPLMVKEIITSIDAYEQRIKITNITYDIVDQSNIKFRILWNYINNDTANSAVVIIDIAPKPELEVPHIVTTPIETPFDLTAEYISDEGVVLWDYTDTTGTSFTWVTVKVAASEADCTGDPLSVAVKVMVSLPFQLTSGMVMVATRFTILTESAVLPAYVQTIAASAVSTSVT